MTQGACRPLHLPHELQSFENTCLAFPEALSQVLGRFWDLLLMSAMGTAVWAQHCRLSHTYGVLTHSPEHLPLC